MHCGYLYLISDVKLHGKKATPPLLSCPWRVPQTAEPVSSWEAKFYDTRQELHVPYHTTDGLCRLCVWLETEARAWREQTAVLRDRARMLLISFSPVAGSLLSWTRITFCPISVLATFISKYLEEVWTRYGGVVVECPISTTGDLLFKMMSRK